LEEQQMKRRKALVPVLMLATAVLVTACGSTSTAKGPPNEPTIDQPGRTISRYSDPLVEVIVDYTYASRSTGDPWLILNVAVTGWESKAVEIRRGYVVAKTPDGRKIPLPEYAEFIEAYPEVKSAARRAALASQPIDFSQAGRQTCDLRFQPLPGTVTALESVFVNMRKICQGLLYFPIQGGVQPGRWEFIIEFEEFDARVPFEIEAPK
jgi:hypothetical protein